MKLKNIFFGALVAIGCGIGANANAVSGALSECCHVLQDECVATNPHPIMCANVYNNCMASRHCIIP